MDLHDHIPVGGELLEIAWHGPGPDEAVTLVFLHEGLGCVSMWRDFPSLLAEATGCGTLVYSRLGYGESGPCTLPRPIRFMHDEGLHGLPELLDVMGVRRCILIGHSDGGSIALIYAGGTGAQPLIGLITEAAHVFCEEISVDSIRKAREAFEHGDLRAGLEKHHGPNTECAFWGWNDVWLDPGFKDWNIEEYLPRIKVPLLAIQGDDDIYGTRAQIDAIEKKAGGPAEVLMLPGCGHSPHIEKPDETLGAMTEFIARTVQTD